MTSNHTQPAAPTNFIRNLINEERLADPQTPVITRFPPEPNGHLHYGHAKSICLNFALAADYGGHCHLRFDDTNPEKEAQEYVDAIIESVKWLGFQWHGEIRYASNYFDQMYDYACQLIRAGKAYVDSCSSDEIRALRGTLTSPGQAGPWRDRSVAENLDLFARMKAGEFAEGEHVLRARIDLASPNINLRDPLIYRIRHISHQRSGNDWCIYPLYSYAHPIEDAIEGITHSICTLEFEDQRPFYDWLLTALAESNSLQRPLPRQIEFARLNLHYTVLSKRKLIRLVEEGHVQGWDDPRLPTLAGARRRGFTAGGFRLFAERIGVTKTDASIDISVLEQAMRDDLNESAPRRVAVLNPLRLIIDNFPADQIEQCQAPNHPQQPAQGERKMPFSRELWIEREDFMETPTKGFRRLYPGNRVRLRYAFVIECTGCDKDSNGNIIAVHANYFADSRSGTAGADQYKVKGNLHWVSVAQALQAQVRLYERLFNQARPGERRAGDDEQIERDFIDDLNPNSLRTITAQLEPALAEATAQTIFQFERHGYFIADSQDSRPEAPVFNRAVTLKDSWQNA